MAGNRDLRAFNTRAENYEGGPRARWHDVVLSRSADVAMEAVPVPLRVLDVGCGTGALLRDLVARLPNVLELVGVDPAEQMLFAARRRAEGHERFVQAAAERLPFGDEHFDLIVSTTSFDHWRDQRRGLSEVARVLQPSGRFVLVELCAGWLSGSRDPMRARTPARAVEVMDDAGLRVEHAKTIYRVAGLPLVRAFVAVH